jgi:CHAT domain-containing protein
LVFFNACHTGRLGKGLAWLSGWPQTLLTAAHVRVYVGTLWAVNDELAAVFSRRFYGALLEGQRLAAALRTARLAVRDHTPENPTWLAYTLYGDPNAAIEFGQGEHE